MSTRVFISWSGELSRQLAEAVRNWLPGVLQFVKPYFTPDDIEKGTKWSTEIIQELENSEIGILCLTKDNLDKPWVLFEAGALSKSIGKSKVCTLLFGIDSSDLSGPLTGFQDTKFSKKDFKKLIESINNEGGESKLKSNILDQVFDMWWERLEKSINQILSGYKEKDHAPTRSDRELLEEILELSRMKALTPIRRTKIPKAVIYDLVDIIEEMSRILIRHGDKIFFSLLERLRINLMQLSKDIDEPELYNKFVHNTGLFSEKYIIKEKIKNDISADS